MTAEMKKANDCELVSQYIRGNEKAFEVLVKRYQNKIYTTIYLIVKDADVADDLLQETFVKAIRTIQSGKYNEEGKFLPWISRIAHNMAIDYFRRQKRYPSVEIEENKKMFNSLEFSEESIEAVSIRQETHAKLGDMIQRLPETQREVLMMRHYMQMSFQEIADATGVSINTALGRMRYALINLRKQMQAAENQLNCLYDFSSYSG